MKSKTPIAAAALAATLAAVLNYARATDPAPASPSKPDAAGVVSITLPVMEPALPPGPGRDAVVAGCVMCHTTRYVTMQPRVSRAAWTANVDKMRKVFGAPIGDAQAAEIVNYLVSIRGVAEAAPAKP